MTNTYTESAVNRLRENIFAAQLNAILLGHMLGEFVPAVVTEFRGALEFSAAVYAVHCLLLGVDDEMPTTDGRGHYNSGCAF